MMRRKLGVQWFAQRALRGMGDENGDVYNPALKALTDKGKYAGHYYRMVRAVQVLEYLPGLEARSFLEELAGGAEHLSLTRETQAALWRINQYWQW
jgi:hypothetical protein